MGVFRQSQLSGLCHITQEWICRSISAKLSHCQGAACGVSVQTVIDFRAQKLGLQSRHSLYQSSARFSHCHHTKRGSIGGEDSCGKWESWLMGSLSGNTEFYNIFSSQLSGAQQNIQVQNSRVSLSCLARTLASDCLKGFVTKGVSQRRHTGTKGVLGFQGLPAFFCIHGLAEEVESREQRHRKRPCVVDPGAIPTLRAPHY